jgi:hypothetical protein
VDFAYCSNCRSTHLPGEHTNRRRSGGRHLAATPPRFQRFRNSQPLPKASSQSPAPVSDFATRTMDVGRQLGIWLAHSSERALFEGRRAARAAGRTLTEGWSKAVEFSGVLDVPSQPSRTTGKHAPVATPQSSPIETMVAVTPGGVGLVEYSTSRDHLLEVSMLESLGFYDPSTVVVAVSAPKATTATIPESKPIAGRAPLIPDLDLVGWKPHVIARSKLNPGVFRLTTAGVVAVATVIVVTLVLAVIRTPQVSEARLHQNLATQATALQMALTSLNEALGSGNEIGAVATTALVDVDIASRGLFEAASRLDPNTDQEMRSAAISVAEQSLDLQSQITQALSYRLVLGPLWRTPDMAALTDPADAAEALAPWQAQIKDLEPSLPDQGSLAGHATEVSTFIGDIDSWVPAYLDSLAVGDTTAAAAALETLESRLAGLAHSAEAVIAEVVTNARAESQLMMSDLVGLAG